jgi:CheY-like chemotaxis protein
MPDTQARLLIVDDEPSIRTSMSQVLNEIGYHVRPAEDGFSALRQIRQEMPDILISDLNMPGMSGFELLSVVRRRFPAIQSIAMSGAFSGDEVPSGVAADAFYTKGSSIGALLQIMGTLPHLKRRAALPSSSVAPVWIQRSGSDASREADVTITCPECLRTFPQAAGNSICQIHETICIYCRSSIQYTIVEPVDRRDLQAFRKGPASAKPRPAEAAQFSY